MNVDPQHLWGTDYDHNPPLTEKALREAEQTLGVRFPPELVALWRIQNGGYTQGFVYPARQRTT
ncbi:MAG: SMI1/KNR4 family protein [Armatimonadetes bacterium]|nr:SMI1/KNR4 family protein [Armatimonadota bacterium]